MIVSNKILTLCDYSSSYYVIWNYSRVENEFIAILAIFHLHNQKHINDDRFKAYCKQYNNNTLLRKVNTYHCKINDKWYSDCNTFLPIMESYKDMCSKTDFDIETILKYLAKLLNKNRNYCIDYLYSKYVNPIIEGIHDTYGIPLIDSLELMKCLSIDNFPISDYSYCCEDCSGDYDDYKKYHYEYYLESLQIDLKEKAKTFLNNKKNESGWRNPHNKMAL